jgi:hypothetical protein
MQKMIVVDGKVRGSPAERRFGHGVTLLVDILFASLSSDALLARDHAEPWSQSDSHSVAPSRRLRQRISGK